MVPGHAIIDFFTFLWISIIVGGRLGYMLLYQPRLLVQDPAIIFSLQMGGMSFHGAVIGVGIFLLLFYRIKKSNPIPILDISLLFAPIALFLGRIGNFINGELAGRITDVPWAMVFPIMDGYLRHPSQLYQAIAEGPVLFTLLYLSRNEKLRGFNTTLFVIYYSLLRIISECFRAPDNHIGYIATYFTYGQLLSFFFLLPCLIIFYLFYWPKLK